MFSLALLASLSIAPTPPVVEERVFNTASELQPWCRREAEAHFVGQGIETYQWTSSHSSSGNVLRVSGKLRAGGKDVAVTCRVARGARERYASIDIQSP